VPPPGRSRYPTRLEDGYDALLPHLAKTREAVALLSAEGLMHATDGDAEKATAAFLAAGRVAESLHEEPTIVSQCVRYGDWAILLPRLERALSLTTFTDSQLASLQTMVEGAERPRAMARAMAVERVFGLSVITDRKVLAMAFRQQGWNRQMADLVTGLAVGMHRASGLQEKDKGFYCDVMARHFAVMGRTYPARLAAAQQLAALTNTPNRFCIFSQMLLPGLVRIHAREANHAALVRVGAVVLAIERFRLAHTNALPNSLEQLIPAFYKTVPTDPFDGKPLRLKTHGASYVVYSIGSDGQDDGGVAWDSNYTKAPQDVSFVVKH
jgi:hypothetical protein